MLDSIPGMDILDKSPTAQALLATVMQKLKGCYANDADLGAALRALVEELRNSSSVVYKEANVGFIERAQITSIVNMLHNTLKG